MTSSLFEGYQHEGFFDEFVDELGEVRPHYRQLALRLGALAPEELARRERLRDAAFRSAGITFTVYGEDEGLERTFPMDLIPRIIPADEWAHVEAGLGQRVTALNLFLDDLYVGERAAVRDGIVPWSLVTSSDGFEREAFGIPVPRGARCLVAGIDLVRDVDGTYRVLEDNLRNPSGISYVLENRAAMTRVLPSVFGTHRVRAVDHYGASLLAALRQVAPAAAGDPTRRRAHARRLQLRVLRARVPRSPDGRRARRGPRPRRRRARRVRCAPPAGSSASTSSTAASTTTSSTPSRSAATRSSGVPGSMAAARAGNVTIANAVGNGVADDKAVYAYVPDLIRYYLARSRSSRTSTTYLLWDADQRAQVLDRLDELVVKPVAESGGYGMLIGPPAPTRSSRRSASTSRRTRATTSRRRSCRCRGTPRSSATTSRAATSTCARSCCRATSIEVIPGGLTRVALRKGSLVVNSRQGGGSKDTWVLVRDGDGATDAGPPRRSAVLDRSLHRARRGHRPHARRDLPRPARVAARGGRAVVARPARGPAASTRPFAERHDEAQCRPRVSEFLVLDHDEPRRDRVAPSGSARENARSVRELISTELWEAVNTFCLELRARNLRADLEDQPYELYGS